MTQKKFGHIWLFFSIAGELSTAQWLMIMWTTALSQRNVFTSILSFIIELLMYNYNEENLFFLTHRKVNSNKAIHVNEQSGTENYYASLQ